MLAKRIKEKD